MLAGSVAEHCVWKTAPVSATWLCMVSSDSKMGAGSSMRGKNVKHVQTASCIYHHHFLDPVQELDLGSQIFLC